MPPLSGRPESARALPVLESETLRCGVAVVNGADPAIRKPAGGNPRPQTGTRDRMAQVSGAIDRPASEGRTHCCSIQL